MQLMQNKERITEMQLSASYVGEKDRYRRITAGIIFMGYPLT